MTFGSQSSTTIMSTLPKSSEHVPSLSNKKPTRPSRSQRKKEKDEAEENEGFDLAEYIRRKKQKPHEKEFVSFEKNKRKSSAGVMKENKDIMNLPMKNKPALKRKFAMEVAKPNISTKKLVKPPDFEKKPKFFKPPPIPDFAKFERPPMNPKSAMKSTTTNLLQLKEMNRRFSHKLEEFPLFEIAKPNLSKVSYPKSVANSFILDASTLITNANTNVSKGKNVSYVPPVHSTREIRKVNFF